MRWAPSLIRIGDERIRLVEPPFRPRRLDDSTVGVKLAPEAKPERVVFHNYSLDFLNHTELLDERDNLWPSCVIKKI
jgi:hypothetical protein